ncbi:hypothetical protein BC938DRAFT_481747 [Jimgerdemannia flammicorona]|uniref:Threonine/serine exporter-like N-terminal domain-containing protein n=1 Tax=Jimgerdemannia flammicorona TaxID=994334 RepID=A0A433QFH7_9FUNG|nr:hypothetical protein BC938DRAFT_481747 [Jimgerdemannia flammicorona]
MSRSASPSLLNLHSTPVENKVQLARTSLGEGDLFRSAEGPQSVAILADRLRITATVADILQRHTLLLKLAKALVRYGAPSHRVVGHIILLKVEKALEKTSRILEIEGGFFYLPGLIMISFGDTETHTSETHLVKSEQGFDMSKLT